MNAELQRADARLRMRFLSLMMLGAVLGAVGIVGLNAYLLELQALAARAQPVAAEKALRAVHAVLGLLAAGATLLSLYLGRTSWRTLSSGRFPPPGARVISDTRIRRGLEARRRGQAGLAVAVLTILVTAFVLYRAERLFRGLLDTTLKPTIFVPVQPSPGR